MIPVQFDYLAPTSVEEALAALGQHGDDAKIMAGGQSLLPVLRMRLNAPEVVIDLGGIASLRGIRDDGDAIVIGAMTTHHDVRDDSLVKEHALLLSKAAAEVADAQIRHRGTFGGALAHADPAGDLGAPALALGAQFVIAGPGGTRTVDAADFFVDLFETAIGDDEILTEVRIPKHTGWGAHYEKFVRVAHQWPIVAVAATVKGSIDEARVGLTNMGSTPLRATATEQALAGASATEDGVREASQLAAEGTNPPSDLNGAADYRQHLARVLTGRAVLKAAGAYDGAEPPLHRPDRRRGDLGALQRHRLGRRVLPGAQVTEADEESFSGSVKVKLGPIALLYNGSGTFVEKDAEAHRFVVDAKGKDKRGNGTAGAKVTVSMAEAGGSTDVSVETDLAITGKPAQFGRGVMQDVSDKLLGQFVACLEQRLAGPAESSDATDSLRRAPRRKLLRSHRGSGAGAAGTARPTDAATAGARGARPRQCGAPRARQVVLEAGAGRPRRAGAAATAAAQVVIRRR